MEKENNTIVTVSVNQGQKLNIAGGEYRIIVSGKQTNGSFAMIEMIVPPGAGPVPHAHPDFEETFYVLEGEVQFTSEVSHYLAKKDDLVLIPKGGVIHHFKNLSKEPAKLLCTVVPAGLDDFFIQVANFMESAKENKNISESEIKEQIAIISDKFGQKLFKPDYFNK
ncbi:cupin domain-containing protein [Flavobacterium sp. 5]|uniref:cupin domain-containing protein n=1 Tax=Flavobacterium sp. 5 TaxID=2035199 RepID=UPI000C2BADD2|nr:cupin domain-containing protein [Flavobacterium sp. 5]PKB15013.1 mannose-6-phosphate isomerase-like protein (cupin superfamily) [Flavobacterium sp. 5]